MRSRFVRLVTQNILVQTELKIDTPLKSYSFLKKNICFGKRASEGQSISCSNASGCCSNAGVAGGVILGSGVGRQVVCTGHASAVEWGRAFHNRAMGRGLSWSLLYSFLNNYYINSE